MFDATPLLRLYARRRLARLAAQDPAATQGAELLKLLRRAAGTRFGQAHGFGAIRNVAEYQSRVPLRSYDAFWEEWWKPAFPVLRDVTWPGLIPYFAASSGTSTGATKYIPVTAEMSASNRRAAFDLLVFHLANRPESRVFGGQSFLLGGSTAFRQLASGVEAGDLSGIAAVSVPRWARSRLFPPAELALLSDWDRKVDEIGRASLLQDIRNVSGTPSWMLLFFEKLRDLCADRSSRLVDYYPNLELVTHGGVGYEPYRARFDEWLEGSHAETREVYPASEGFIAMADRGSGEGLRMELDNGLFYEFIPVDELGRTNPTRHWIGNAEPGVNYALALSSNAGLFSYLVGDTVRLIERSPARLMVTGRTSYSLSAFGEHLIGSEIDTGITEAAENIGADVADYSVGAVYPQAGSPRGGHVFVVEFGRPLREGETERFAAVLDETLARLNLDYADHRRDDFGMMPPRILLASKGTFAAWMAKRGKLGGQNKVPRVIGNDALLADLIAFVQTFPEQGS
ncbi:GH3 auxin-responsive promoter [Faunimonas pinastri]|uniref:GH3 auxin-responsive promoter n=1 Tax=Faunimonas pinastri TaxID=1855383 RepID=A0A1H9AMZ7_9HYPH|nr:GH3 auxin-responsive promoter family protein [Faunimonas pinastri]SEP78039.1 GH3 auxin-responsive promoter [Faunimonas pinastri]